MYVARLAGVLLVLCGACRPPAIDDRELLQEVREFELQIARASTQSTRELLRALADDLVHRHLRVSSAVVASSYRRDNVTRVYFGTDYDESNHLYLADIDADFERWFERHEHWVSIVKTYPDRQVSYELAIDRETYLTMERGRRVSFVCELAAVIRGRSVYCRALEVVQKGELEGV